mmetsp:Transcript_43039/g.98976  ORF Transcript_43039/g.98976 Transcript_43039/m.98976 type:complete len:91 (+) Transcript_43039:2-274(+)
MRPSSSQQRMKLCAYAANQLVGGDCNVGGGGPLVVWTGTKLPYVLSVTCGATASRRTTFLIICNAACSAGSEGPPCGTIRSSKYRPAETL